ncbi:hypothetical protein BO86DRAFT_390509 [Aspergillus japonicus CBS 114.51]|uniref:Uncharacterized protein n=1 Tax=Aspergillus japonicus CBS 114.51 TaxID=1448312 RepID=A0A8T8WXI4_ASPJA|nr:hypothetical protein BO86DRAFT_390509 [Aspergillus japonicus CBS 114.51]RAH80102.1 hypothetical protein BO86DRAFT_390509 [Aspergillus japonicus CBS 114.51]
MGAGKPYPPSLPDPDQYVVKFSHADDCLLCWLQLNHITSLHEHVTPNKQASSI